MKTHIELVGTPLDGDKGKLADILATLSIADVAPGDAFDLGKPDPTGPSRIAYLNRRFFNADKTVTFIFEIGFAPEKLSLKEWHVKLREFLTRKSAIMHMTDMFAAQLAEFVFAQSYGRKS